MSLRLAEDKQQKISEIKAGLDDADVLVLHKLYLLHFISRIISYFIVLAYNMISFLVSLDTQNGS